MVTTLIGNNVSRSWNHLVKRLGEDVTYKRFKSMTYDPTEGETKTFWEQVEIEAVRGPATEENITGGGGLIKSGDMWISFPLSQFAQQEGESSQPYPTSGDEIVIDGVTWTTDLADKTVWEIDPSQTLLTVWMRRA